MTRLSVGGLVCALVSVRLKFGCEMQTEKKFDGPVNLAILRLERGKDVGPRLDLTGFSNA